MQNKIQCSDKLCFSIQNQDMPVCTPCTPMFYPLSSLQREICFDQSLTPEAPIYNIGGYHRIEGDFDPEIFRRAIRQLAQETDILRLCLCPQEDLPLQSFPQRLPIPVKAPGDGDEQRGVGTGGGEMDAAAGGLFDDAGAELEQAQPEGGELGCGEPAGGGMASRTVSINQ